MSGATNSQRRLLLLASGGILIGLIFGLFVMPFSGAYPEPQTAYSYDHDAGDDPGGGDHGGDDSSRAILRDDSRVRRAAFIWRPNESRLTSLASLGADLEMGSVWQSVLAALHCPVSAMESGQTVAWLRFQ